MSMIKHPHAFPQLAKRQSFDRSSTVKTVRPIGQDREPQPRYVVLLTFALFAAVFAAIIALRVAVWLPAFQH